MMLFHQITSAQKHSIGKGLVETTAFSCHCNPVVSKLAAELLGIGRTTLYSRMKLFGIDSKEQNKNTAG
ncbi:hypothetical protein B5G04_06930 [Bacteroides sp. An51A]|nr:hypothetical protein B5G04_06930 [Bacteroides sp. An51A]